MYDDKNSFPEVFFVHRVVFFKKGHFLVVWPKIVVPQRYLSPSCTYKKSESIFIQQAHLDIIASSSIGRAQKNSNNQKKTQQKHNNKKRR